MKNRPHWVHSDPHHHCPVPLIVIVITPIISLLLLLLLLLSAPSWHVMGVLMLSLHPWSPSPAPPIPCEQVLTVAVGEYCPSVPIVQHPPSVHVQCPFVLSCPLSGVAVEVVMAWLLWCGAPCPVIVPSLLSHSLLTPQAGAHGSGCGWVIIFITNSI